MVLRHAVLAWLGTRLACLHNREAELKAVMGGSIVIKELPWGSSFLKRASLGKLFFKLTCCRIFQSSEKSTSCKRRDTFFEHNDCFNLATSYSCNSSKRTSRSTSCSDSSRLGSGNRSRLVVCTVFIVVVVILI